MLSIVLEDDVRLRPLRDDDAEPLYDVVSRHREALARWLPWAAGQTLESQRAFVREARMQSVIEVGGLPLGTMGLHAIDERHGITSIGYWLSPDAQGRGIMTRAVAAHLDHVFGPLGLHRMELQAAVGNDRSRALARRLGFREEGVRRQAELFPDGRREDLVLHALLAPEWRDSAMRIEVLRT